MAVNQECSGNLKRQLEKLFDASLRSTVPDKPRVKPVVTTSPLDRSGDYQCNNAMGLWSMIKGKDSQFKGPPAVGEALLNNLPTSEMVESCSFSVTGPGFVNVVLSTKWMAKSIANMLIDGINTWAPTPPVKRALVDFSSPNIAKEMHVGHLRSTVIGDTLARMLEFSKVEVLRRNHVGDWGTQFGMLIEYLFEKFPDTDSVTETAIGDLQSFYKESKKKFDDDPDFKEKAQKAVVRLQGGDPIYRKAWAKICEISRTEFSKVYQRLQVELEEKGESFYNPYIANVIGELDSKGLIEESEGARVIFLQGFKIPLIVVKTDGGFNYASTCVLKGERLLRQGARCTQATVPSPCTSQARASTDLTALCASPILSSIQSLTLSCLRFESRLHIVVKSRLLFDSASSLTLLDRRSSLVPPLTLASESSPPVSGSSSCLLVVFCLSFWYHSCFCNVPVILLVVVYIVITMNWYRLNEEKAEWIIYVTDFSQKQHFDMFFKAARKAGWLPDSDKTYPRVDHVDFGLVVNGEDRKRFRTRASDVVRLVDLLD
ncbi:hypothetical protein DY000_02054360 [Brassica cretica]|uniref:Arginyl-tRNA synthetase n=1 Tax=Brassica cretica TaxID=69181 RepID=A0ABQ7ALT0_BRACR|nr:hypothetical protein DY000_02054360 [Brassica cretica]